MKQRVSGSQAYTPVVGGLSRRLAVRPARMIIFCAIGVILVVAAVAVVGTALVNRRQVDTERSLYADEQQTLQGSLTTALNYSDFQTQVDATSLLIDGQKAGHFTFDNKTLAQYYSDRGVAYVNLKQYANAVPDFEKARSLDPMLKQSSLQGEVQARYDMGQRRQLVPLFQELAKLAQNSTDQRSGTPEMYQQYIQEIQQGQDIQL